MNCDRLGILRVWMCFLFDCFSIPGRFSFSLIGVLILTWRVLVDEARLPSTTKVLAVERDERPVLVRTSKDCYKEAALLFSAFCPIVF